MRTRCRNCCVDILTNLKHSAGGVTCAMQNTDEGSRDTLFSLRSLGTLRLVVSKVSQTLSEDAELVEADESKCGHCGENMLQWKCGKARQCLGESLEKQKNSLKLA